MVNDASGLIAYKYALAAIMAGNFVLWEAGLNFVWVILAGVAIGLIIGFLMYLVHKNFICEPVIEVTLTLLTPFASYMIAEYFNVSGVLAVVTTGLYLSFRSDVIFTNESRIMAYSVWESILFILNGLIFILIGLQLRNVMEGIKDYSGSELAWYGLAISAVVIIVRFIWVIPGSRRSTSGVCSSPAPTAGMSSARPGRPATRSPPTGQSVTCCAARFLIAWFVIPAAARNARVAEGTRSRF